MNHSRAHYPWDGRAGRQWPGWVYAGGAAGVCVAGYLLTVCPTLAYGGDGGDLTASSFTLGISHPTGYPLYMVLGKLFALVPVGDVAFRYNLFSAVSAGGAVFVTALLVCELTRCGAAGLLAGVTTGFLYVVWTQSVIAEVYALGLFFQVLLLLAAFRWSATGDARWFLTVGFGAGLAAAHHLSSVFVAAPAFVYCLVAGRGRPAVRRLALGSMGLALAGVAFYAYLPVRAAASPALNWGDPSTWPAFVAHVTGRLYRPHLFGVPVAALPERLLAFGVFAALELFLSVLWTPVGVVALVRRHGGFAALLGSVAALNLALNIRYDVGDLWNFLLPAFLVSAVVAGVGMGTGITYLEQRRPGQGGGMGVMLATAGVVLQVSVTASVPEVNLHGNRLAREYNEATLASVPAGAALFEASDENLFAVWYLQQVEGKAPAVEPVSAARAEQTPGGLLAAVAGRLRRQRVFCAFYPEPLTGAYALRGGDFVTEVTRRPPPLHPCPLQSGTIVVHSRGVTVNQLQPVRLRLKKGNSTGLTVHWTLAAEADRSQAVTLELVAAPGTPRTASPVKTRPPAGGLLDTGESVTRWTLHYVLGDERNLNTLPDGRAVSLRETLCFTVPWNARVGRYQVFIRLHVGAGPESVSTYRRVAALSVFQR